MSNKYNLNHAYVVMIEHRLMLEGSRDNIRCKLASDDGVGDTEREAFFQKLIDDLNNSIGEINTLMERLKKIIDES